MVEIATITSLLDVAFCHALGARASKGTTGGFTVGGLCHYAYAITKTACTNSLVSVSHLMHTVD
jgi:hypothetical protein